MLLDKCVSLPKLSSSSNVVPYISPLLNPSPPCVVVDKHAQQFHYSCSSSSQQIDALHPFFQIPASLPSIHMVTLTTRNFIHHTPLHLPFNLCFHSHQQLSKFVSNDCLSLSDVFPYYFLYCCHTHSKILCNTDFNFSPHPLFYDTHNSHVVICVSRLMYT